MLAHMQTERFICPLCREPFGSEFLCPQGHRFDTAREGYIHLLPVQKKGSREPGDNPDMLTARRTFLEGGHYQPIVEAITTAFTHTGTLTSLLDLGAGEGYYTQAMAQAFPEAAVYGIDISKAGIRAAARRYPHCRFAIASNRDLPLADQSFSHAMNIFAPLVDEELARILLPEGYLVRVSPAPEHLREIKALLYKDVLLHPEDTYHPQGFHRIDRTRVQQPFVIRELTTLHQLIHMTPYAWKLNHIGPTDLSTALPLTITLDVWVTIWRKLSILR